MRSSITSILCRSAGLLFVYVTTSGIAYAAEPTGADLAAAIRAVDAHVVPKEQAADVREAVRREVRVRLKAAEERESKAWYAVKTKADWEAYRKPRLEALRRSLGTDPLPTEPRNLRVTSTLDGDGFTIENIVFESRPFIEVTGNLYRPKQRIASAPGILICHSHHAAKTQSELQDMGMTWARQGAVVLVIDQLGHGERRTHEFGTAGKFPSSYRPERQDYHFRYNTGVQLDAVGESLIGYMVGDLMCGVSLLRDMPEVDRNKIVLLGAVAGGGDPAGVAGALDERIAAVVPFNFGGYEPEDGFPLPDDAETSFRYAGSGSWESTRNLKLSARDGFLPWTIIAASAPRRLVYAHEFRWDEPRDPVWKRLRAVFGFYDATDRLGSIVGHGGVRQSSAEASHCTNIGPIHRAQLYPLLDRWFAFPVPTTEYRGRRDAAELRCLPIDEPTSSKGPRPMKLHFALMSLIETRKRPESLRRTWLKPDERRRIVREELRPLLGRIEPVDVQGDAPRDRGTSKSELIVADALPIAQEIGGPIPLPLVMLRTPQTKPGAPVVVAVAQGGKENLLKDRAEFFAACLRKGATVVAVDLRGTGETQPADEGRGRTSGATSRSATERMLGETTLGGRLRDLRGVLAYLRRQERFKNSPLVLYGDGLVAANDRSMSIAAPLDADGAPKLCEPLGAEVCLLAALYDDDIQAVYTGGGLASHCEMLDFPYFYIPHDVLFPGMAGTASLSEILASQTARVWVADLRDGVNRALDDGRRSFIAKLTEKYLEGAFPAGTPRSQAISLTAPAPDELAAWLLDVGPRTR